MISDIAQKQIEDHLAALLKESHLELFELSFKKRNKIDAVEIVIDKDLGGVTINECAYINRQIDNFIEQNQLSNSECIVEVSSPGLDRPLRTQKDFAKAVHKNIRVYLSQKYDDRMEYEGVVDQVNENEVGLTTTKGSVLIPFHLVQKAVRVI